MIPYWPNDACVTQVAENHGEVVTGLFFLSLVEPNRDVAGGVRSNGTPWTISH